MNIRSKYFPLRRSSLAALVMAVLLCGCYNTLSSDSVPSSKSEAQRLGSAVPSPAPPHNSGVRNAAQAELLMDSSMALAEAEVIQTASLFPLPALPVAALSVAEAAAPVQPYLVKTMEIYLQVDEVKTQSAAIQSLAVELGGYLSELNESGDGIEGTTVRQTLRIPALRLEEAMTRIEALGRILQRSLTTQDVTLQFVDMNSRLRNLEKTEGRLLAHLEQSGDMQAILNVEKEIDRVRGEIETVQGRINDLANQIGFATVRVTLAATPSAGPISPASTFSTGSVFTDALRNLVGFAQGLWFIVIWVTVWCPVWVPLAFTAHYIYRKNAKKNSVS